MKLTYSLEPIYNIDFVEQRAQSLFLAGPTHRIIPNVVNPMSWRKEAIVILRRLRFEGEVFVPEFKFDILPEKFTLKDQVEWECQALKKATVIMFWIPRNLVSLPAFTTNIEFGEWMQSGKIVIGAPYTAEKNEYLQERCRRLGIIWHTDLESLLKSALAKL